ncbi:MAG: sigma-70 family RNA polymerase sigma factor [Myxococcota bacterium]
MAASAPQAPVPITVDSAADLYRAHKDRVYRLALRYSAGDIALAEDITQDVFVTLWRHQHAIDGHDLGGWLYRVTTNRCLSHLRRERLRRTVWQALGLRPRWIDPEPEVVARADVARVLDVVRQLPPKERVVFSMRFLDDKSQDEIAEVLGHSKGYVSKLVHRAIKRVRAAGWEVQP